MAKMNEKFLQVIKDPGPATIVTVDGNPAHVVNTWSQYIKVIDDHTLLIPAAGMHSIEGDIDKGKNELTITVGSFKVPGTEGMGAGFHIHGTGKFETSGPFFDMMKAEFEWIRAVLVVTVTDIEQKI